MEISPFWSNEHEIDSQCAIGDAVVGRSSQTHGSLVAQEMTQRADVRAQVFKVLTPAQQTQLTSLEAQMRSSKHGHWGGPPDGAPAAQ